MLFSGKSGDVVVETTKEGDARLACMGLKCEACMTPGATMGGGVLQELGFLKRQQDPQPMQEATDRSRGPFCHRGFSPRGLSSPGKLHRGVLHDLQH